MAMQLCHFIYIGVNGKYNKALLCYNLCRSLLASRFQFDSCYAQIPAFYADIFLFVFHCAVNVRDQVPVDCLWSIANDSARDARTRGEGSGTLVAKKLRECAHGIILARHLLPQFGSRSCRGPGKRAPRIMRECDRATVIAIRSLTQPCTCEMGSSIFPAMSRLKVASSTRASFPSMPSTERTH